MLTFAPLSAALAFTVREVTEFATAALYSLTEAEKARFSSAPANERDARFALVETAGLLLATVGLLLVGVVAAFTVTVAERVERVKTFASKSDADAWVTDIFPVVPLLRPDLTLSVIVPIVLDFTPVPSLCKNVN